MSRETGARRLPLARPPARRFLVEQWLVTTPAQLSATRAGLAARVAPPAGRAVGPAGGADAAARRLLGGEAHDARGLARTPDHVALVASELATNALRHGLGPAVVRLFRDVRDWVLEVSDHDPASAPVYAGRRAPGDGGLGLHVARHLATEVGWYVDDGTKTVWASFPVVAGGR